MREMGQEKGRAPGIHPWKCRVAPSATIFSSGELHVVNRQASAGGMELKPACPGTARAFVRSPAFFGAGGTTLRAPAR
jgi:hypothetical protein